MADSSSPDPINTPLQSTGEQDATRRSTLGIVIWAVALGLLCLSRVTVGVEEALHFNGQPADGPFQLFNALRRIAAGQRPGVDFQFFHGMGVPFLHYIPFRLFGGGLAGSELARQFVSILAYPAVLVVFFRAFTREWARTLALSAIVYALSLMLNLNVVVGPLVSLLGVRSALATLIPAVMLVRRGARPPALLVGAALGGSMLLGTEQGMSVIVAFTLVTVIRWWRTRDRSTLMALGLSLAVATGTLLGFLLLVGGPSGMRGALTFNFKLVPMDQFWYFGVPASNFAPTWRALFIMMRQMPRIPWTLSLTALVIGIQLRRLWREPAGPAGDRHAALAVVAIYGLFSCASLLGIFYETYVYPCVRILLLVGALELDHVLAARDARAGAPRRLGVSRGTVVVAQLAGISMLVKTPNVVLTLVNVTPSVIGAHLIHRQGLELKGMWPQTILVGQHVIDTHRGPHGEPPTLWSVYSGLIEAQNGIFNPTPFDYTLHALGPRNRAWYVQRFREVKPTLVQTVLPTYLMWEIWMEQTSWDFYDELLRNYRVVAETPWSIYWERVEAPHAAAQPLWSATLPPGARQIELPLGERVSADTGVLLVRVELEYAVHNPLHVLPLFGAAPRYFVSAENTIFRFPVTLDPYTTTARFPLLVVRGHNPTLMFQTYSLLPGASVDVRAVRVASLPVSQDNVPWLVSLIDEERARQRPGPGGDTTGLYQWR